ncbi:ABC transporter permease [Paenibacillus radicis (ex Gao et al. 2016)]|uniref:ABC transporter permease n=1 Tax=Paenibacillus radicis (ex Gao et al. 2016) TaxID=1737354 RepID=A0A917GZ21_9BACL|nr:ABC transporter permease [Paenibacillus radicis (ex Gao et al. 2016)]GGG61993.1 ABC transporter permease [Paenibacillus radicis (ex Gao et al. 2016)]
MGESILKNANETGPEVQAVLAVRKEGVSGREASRNLGPSGVQRLKNWLANSAVMPPLLAFAGLFILWELLVRVLGIEAITLPAPSSVLKELATSFVFYLPHAWVTLYEAVIGFLLGTLVAFIGGVLMAHSRLLERTLLPIAVLANVTPVVAIAPLFIIWFGFGALPKILISAIITFFPMLVNSIMGFRSVDENNHEYMRSLHASKWEIFMKLRLPNSLPYLFSAARTCVSLSVIGAVVGEWSGSTQGLGNIVMMASNYMQMQRMFAAILMLAIMGIALVNIVRFIERRVLSWHVSEQKQG